MLISFCFAKAFSKLLLNKELEDFKIIDFTFKIYIYFICFFLGEVKF